LSTKGHKEYFEDANQVFNFDITHFETRLRSRTAHLAAGFEAVVVFVNDEIDRITIGILKENGVSVVALRCAGFNNVDQYQPWGTYQNI
jgi:D-lactate dehydrogenase